MGLRFLTAGESHGPAMTAILEGVPAGLTLSIAEINQDLARRQKTLGAGGRMRIETDQAKILSGVMAGKTTGGPITVLVENRDHSRWQGKAIDAYTTPRPGHADLNGVLKYGYDDIRPSLERASARETVSRVAVGAICRQLLQALGVQVGGYVVAIGDITSDCSGIDLTTRLIRALENAVGCPDQVAADLMETRINEVMQARDTLGGIIEIVAIGLPPGLGSFVQSDRRLDASLGAAVLSVQAMKGVEIGEAFENAHLAGTQAHDPILLVDGKIIRPTNRCGGLEGGITTGQPLIMRAAMKPIATTLTPQKTVNLVTGEETETTYERSDFCPVPRAVVILESVVAIVLAKALLEKLGGDSLAEILPRLETLRQARLEDIHLDGQAHTWWED